MKRTKLLEEQYEDALFAMLMDRVAIAEGVQLIEKNRELQKNFDFEVPHTLDQKCKRIIRRTISKNNRKMTHDAVWKITQRALVAAMLAILMITGVFAAVPSVRINVLNMIIETFETHADIRFAEEKEALGVFSIDHVWVPIGFMLADEHEEEGLCWKSFSDSEGNRIYIEKMSARGQNTVLDTEDAIVSEITIQNYEGILIEKENSQIIFVLEKDIDMTYFLFTEGLSTEETMRIAESSI